MGLLSPKTSIIRYRVEGEIEKPVTDHILNGIKKNLFIESEDNRSETVYGWTSFENPFFPDSRKNTFLMGTDFIFSLRIDKKSIPPKLIHKQYSLEVARRMTKSGRDYLSRNEKKEIKEQIVNRLRAIIPATPHIFDLIWKVEDKLLIFFSTLKTANEILESLFFESFNIPLIRIFPYTMADLGSGLYDTERDNLNQTTPSDLVV